VKKVETKTFIKGKFTEYYKKYASTVPPPTSIEKREFGFLFEQEKIMLRHKGFRNVDDLREFLKKRVPSDVYYSGAYYEKPEEEMEEKVWLGADLIFDIDADHIPTPCNKIHDKWTCNNCGFVGKGVTPEKCPACGEARFDEKTWPCEVCLESAKRETMKLVEALMDDFGFPSEKMNASFSGHRGYHLHVESDEILSLDPMARKEIVDYIVGIGLEPEFHGLEKISGPRLDDLGWRGRIARGTYDFLLKATPEKLEEVGLQKRIINAIETHKERLIQSWKEKGPWGIIGIKGGRKIAQLSVERESAKIDTVVTTDIHRLIRLTNTLHGKTGLKKTEVPLTKLEHFDPFKSAVAFKEGTVTVFVSEAPKLKLEDEIYGPYKEQKIELPTAVAMLLLCKGAAGVVE